MDGHPYSIENVIKSTYKLIIPVYQRNYAWSIKDCERLFDDLIAVHDKNQNHFFGSVVVKSGSSLNEEIIIDGQQRITTISLLYLAISKWLAKPDHVSECNYTTQNINADYLMNIHSRDIDKIKLHLNPRDDKNYQKLFNDNEQAYNESSSLTRNYQYFYKRLTNLQQLTVDDIIEAIARLEVILITLGPDDDAQLIFESLNSTGVALTEGDKIRNFLLMNEDITHQNDYFIKYWEPLENRTGNVSEFFKDYLTLKLPKTPNYNNIYWNFVDFYKQHVIDKQIFLKSLSNYAIAYQQVTESNSGYPSIDSVLKRLNHLNVGVAKPFLMAIMFDLNQNKITIDQFYKILQTIESYIARRMIVKIPSNALNKVFGTLYRDMYRLSENSNAPLNEIVNYLILRKINSARIPSDEEIVNSLSQNDFYHINSSFRTYLFERLENYDNIENLQIYQGVAEQKYSIEHIMPQHLNESWRENLGNDYEKIHSQYLNVIGNLTLTGYNSQYSNRSFTEKQNMKKGFKDSHFVNLNKIPARVTQWGENEIKERTTQLTNLALSIWKLPQTTYQPKNKTKEAIIYDGTQTFIGDKIKGYSFINDEVHSVNKWKNFYIDIVQQIADLNITLLTNFIISESNKKDNYRYFILDSKINKENLPDYFEISTGLFLKTNISNWDKFQIIKHLFDIYRIPYSNLEIYLQESKN